MILAHLRRSLILGLVALVLTFAYAYLGTGVSQLFFKHQADGSITPNGSVLIGQNWSSPKWFHGRPDDTGPYASAKTNPAGHPGDDPLVANGAPGESGGTNLGPRSAKLVTFTEELVAYWHKLGVNPTPDLVTTSGSGYDPDISSQDAIVQIPMVSKATGVSPSALRALIARETNGEQLGFLGSSYIDVLQLNEALAHLR
ncbi:MAG: potassium-transporting ATPase subunit C [Acidimicrobiales bacterium]